MRTEDDLRRALAEAPEPGADLPALLHRVTAGAARRRRARVAGAALGTALAVIAVAVPVTVLRHRGDPLGSRPVAGAGDTRTAGPATAPPAFAPVAGTRLRFAFSVDPVSGYRIRPTEISPRLQAATIERAGPAPFAGEVVVYPPGRLAAEPIRRTGTAVRVNGRPGYHATVVDPDTPGGGKRLGEPALYWEYASNAWAVVQGDWPAGSVEVEQLRIARAVRFGRVPFGVPYRLGYLPADLRVDSGTLFWSGQDWRSIVDFSAAGPVGQRRLTIEVARGPGGGPVRPPDGQPTTTVAGRPAFIGSLGTTVYFDRYLVRVTGPYGQLRNESRASAERRWHAEQKRIVEQLVWAPAVLDRGTWFDEMTVRTDR